MLGALRFEKLRDCRASFIIGGYDPHLRAPWKIRIDIANDIFLPRHHCCARHVAHVNERWSAEISGFKSVLNELHVRANLSYVQRIEVLALELDAAAVGRDVEPMRRGVLVHAHCHFPACLHCRERGIRSGAVHREVLLVGHFGVSHRSCCVLRGLSRVAARRYHNESECSDQGWRAATVHVGILLV